VELIRAEPKGRFDASGDDPESVVQAYLDGNLNLADNPCDH
jgi:hypothetical protein